MRELTEAEINTVGGGSASDYMRYVGALDPAQIKSLHAEVRSQMQKLIDDLQWQSHNSS